MAQNQKPLIHTATVKTYLAYVPKLPQRIFIKIQDTELFVASAGGMPDSADVAVTYNVHVPIYFRLRDTAAYKYTRSETNNCGLVVYPRCIAIESYIGSPKSPYSQIELNGYNRQICCNYRSKNGMRFVQIDLPAGIDHVKIRDEVMNMTCIPPSLLKLESWSCRTNVEAYELTVMKPRD
jgi:hypothetical protein